jgi:hypothetical protein
MHNNAMKCNKTPSKWCKNKHGASKIIDTFETYHVLGTHLGTPRGRYDEHSSKSSLSMKLMFIEPVGERTNFRRLMLAGLATAPDNLYMAPYPGRSFAAAATWNLHTTQPKYFTPTYSEVVHLTGLL